MGLSQVKIFTGNSPFIFSPLSPYSKNKLHSASKKLLLLP